MELSTFATIIGILELIIGIPFLVASAATAAFLLKVIRNDVFMRTFGAVGVMLTVIVLQDGYQVGTDAAGLIRLIAWIGLIKGLTAAWFPGFFTGISESVFGNAQLRPVIGIPAVAIGVLLLYGAQLV